MNLRESIPLFRLILACDFGMTVMAKITILAVRWLVSGGISPNVALS